MSDGFTGASLGIFEVAIILAVIVLIFGSKRIIELFQSVKKGAGEFRDESGKKNDNNEDQE